MSCIYNIIEKKKKKRFPSVPAASRHQGSTKKKDLFSSDKLQAHILILGWYIAAEHKNAKPDQNFDFLYQSDLSKSTRKGSIFMALSLELKFLLHVTKWL